eukprot:TRINITY_DN1569_c0_g1_i14.p2 TRINITY_DN1569_c0_g1~~TRINITY_DN1569_c0_g1_i14.p2  ORF type:complete len:189 (-),score=41.84 TRINITY_DN1569_c0_g1_i14:429-995(-)
MCIRDRYMGIIVFEIAIRQQIPRKKSEYTSKKMEDSKPRDDYLQSEETADPEFRNGYILSIPEIYYLLESLHDKKQDKLSKNKTATLNPVFQQFHEYVKKFTITKEKDPLLKLQHKLINYELLNPKEQAAMMNLVPREPEEARTLIRSLERIEDDNYLREIIDELERHRQIQAITGTPQLLAVCESST